MRSQLLLLATLVAASTASDCSTGYTLCAPSGATSVTPPKIGSTEFLSLFVDIASSSLPSSSKRSENPLEERGSASLCCIESLSCLTMANLAIPFCYDRFTTNYFLPDGSYGTVVGGTYTSSSGDKANLETGDYTLASGATGNLYSANPNLKPNTATLPLPSQFTGSGVGSAIPITNLGSPVTLTYVLTIPGTTVAPSTVPGTTSLKTILQTSTTTVSISGAASATPSLVIMTSVSTESESATVIPGTTRDMSITTVTTTSVGSLGSSSSSSSSPAATTTKGAGVRGKEVRLGAALFAVMGMGLLWFL